MPASISLRRIIHGVGAVGSMPVTLRTTNRGQPNWSSMCTGHDSPSAAGTSIDTGSMNGTSSAHASSLPRPRTDNA